MRIALAATLSLTLPLALAACSQESEPPVESEVAPVGTTDDEHLRDAERSLADPTEQGPTRQLTAIPQRFRGVWDAVDGNCAPASDLRIEIGERVRMQGNQAHRSVHVTRLQGLHDRRMRSSNVGEVDVLINS